MQGKPGNQEKFSLAEGSALPCSYGGKKLKGIIISKCVVLKREGRLVVNFLNLTFS